MTATYDITTDVGKVRMLISDKDVTPATDAHFTDEELQAFLTMAGSVNLAAAMALEAWAATESSSAQSEKIGDYSYSKKTADNKLALAARYRENESLTPSMTWAEMALTETEIEEEDV